MDHFIKQGNKLYPIIKFKFRVIALVAVGLGKPIRASQAVTVIEVCRR